MRSRFFGALLVAASVVVVANQIATGQAAQGPAQSGADPQSIPKTADGHPDLNGMWNGRAAGAGGGNANAVDEKGNVVMSWKVRPCHPGQECAVGVNLERDSGVQQRMSPNKPLYKPEFWDKVQYLDEYGNKEDPGNGCLPAGVPRMGAPTRIIQTAKELVFLYQNKNTFRIIPFRRTHDPIAAQDETFMGDSIGNWEGDTLVIDVVGLTGETWLAWPGYFHTNNLHVIERYRRDGNIMHYDVTVEDPDVLMQPWVMDSRTIRLNLDPNAALIQDLPCQEQDWKHLVTRERG